MSGARRSGTRPRAGCRHPCSTEKATVWAIRYTCGSGHLHKEKVGSVKSEAVRLYHERRGRAHSEPGWCPTVARQRERERARIEHEREAKRLGFRAYAQQYLAWAKLRHRGWDTEKSRVTAMSAAFVDMKLDAITTADVESFQDGLLEKRSQSTANRYRTLMHAMFNRAIRHGLLTVNPVKGVAKFKEPEGRIQYLMPEEEAAVRAALAPEALRTGRPKLDTVRPDLRPLFAVSVHTGLRWSEQLALRWADVDLLTGLITMRHSNTGYSRQVPMNSVVRSAALDLAAQRGRPDDPEEPVFRCSYTAPDKFFPKAVERARKVLMDAGRDASRLDGYTWHCNRHSFASRLVMAGVDLRTVQVLGGWRTLAMVQRYSHLAPAHLREAVERLVPAAGGVELSRNYPEPAIRAAGVS